MKKITDRMEAVFVRQNEEFQKLSSELREILTPKLHTDDQLNTFRLTYSDPQVEQLISAYWAALGAVLSISEMIKHIRMANRYPWRGEILNKSEHLSFVYNSFTHHCYIAEERAKVCDKHYNQLVYGKKRKKPSRFLTEVIEAVKKETKFRGKYTHQWSQTIQEIEFLSFYEITLSYSDVPKPLFDKLYRASKRDLIENMRETCLQMLFAIENKEVNPVFRFFKLC